MNCRVFRLIALAALSLSSLSAQAVVITYDLADLGGNQYRYDYTVTNDGSITSNVGLFDILFDPALYDELSLANVSSPALASDWDQIFLSSGIGVSAAFDVLALGSGINVGESIAGFSVEFTWLGADLPGMQGFEIYDPITFDFLGTGSTTFQPTASVPEPGTLPLFTLALVAVIFIRRRMGTTCSTRFAPVVQ